MKTKIIPFDLETAEKIRKGEIEGKIVRNGREVIVLDYNSKKYPSYPVRIAYLDKDEVDYVTPGGLHIEVPDNEPPFKPFDRVLVREDKDDFWHPDIFSMWHGQFAECIGHDDIEYIIPYEGNEELVGTTNNPE